MNNRKFLLTAFSVGLLLILAACSSSQTVNVSLTTFKVDAQPASISAGKVTFHVTNAATDLVHEMIVIQTDLDGSKLPVDSTGAVDLTKLTVLGSVKNLAAGASQDLTVDLKSGHYVLLCNIAGHYASGMWENFTVN